MVASDPTPPVLTQAFEPDVLRAIIAHGESLTVEFKGEARKQLSDGEFISAAVCLANGRGGVLLLGVEDDGQITGVRERPDGRVDPRQVEALFMNRTVPRLQVECAVVPLDGRDVVVVRVDRSLDPVARSDGLFTRRTIGGDGKAACLPFFHSEMQARAANLRRLDYSALVLPDASPADLDPLAFAQLRQLTARNPADASRRLADLSDAELLRALELVDGSQLRVAALLLLGSDEALRRFVPTHEIAFVVTRGTDVVAKDFLRVSLLRAIDEVSARFAARNNEREFMYGLLRIGVPDYSPTAFREALLNACVHRDYATMGAVRVEWRAGELRISNPGGFVEGIERDALFDVGPRPRNPILASAFERIGLVEKVGRGVRSIFVEQLRVGRPAPDYSRSSAQQVEMALPGGDANLDLVRFVLSQEDRGVSIGLEELLAINTIDQDRRISAIDLATVLRRTPREAQRVLERLTEPGILEARGERAARIWRFAPATYAALGRAADSIRARRFAPHQHRAMVVDYVRENGRITRGELADLCRASSDEAKHLLRKLVAEGVLVMVGEKRGAYYTLAPTALDNLSKHSRTGPKHRSKT